MATNSQTPATKIHDIQPLTARMLSAEIANGISLSSFLEKQCTTLSVGQQGLYSTNDISMQMVKRKIGVLMRHIFIPLWTHLRKTDIFSPLSLSVKSLKLLMANIDARQPSERIF